MELSEERFFHRQLREYDLRCDRLGSVPRIFPGHYSFWDYQAGAFNRDDGIRIDHALLTPQAADRLTSAWIERELRAREKPSDHVPLWIDLDL